VAAPEAEAPAVETPVEPPAEPMPEPAPEGVERKEVTRTLVCVLPDSEVAHKALEIRRLEKEVERIKADARLQIKPREGMIGQLQKEIDEGEERPVVCLEERDYRTNLYRLTRLDTGAEVDTRALRAEERQRELPPVQHPDPAPE
jgi:hypothetical protein